MNLFINYFIFTQSPLKILLLSFEKNKTTTRKSDLSSILKNYYEIIERLLEIK